MDWLEMWLDANGGGATFTREDVERIAAAAATKAVADDRAAREAEQKAEADKAAEASKPKPLTPQMQTQLKYYKDHPEEWQQFAAEMDEALGGQTGRKLREFELKDQTRDLLEEFKLGKSALSLLTADTYEGRVSQAKALRTELDSVSATTKTGEQQDAGSGKDAPAPAAAPALRPLPTGPSTDPDVILQRQLDEARRKAEG